MIVKVGLMGLGNIITNHVEGLKAHPEFEVMGGCDLNPEKVETWTKKLECEGFTDYQELLAKGPDVVVVALPHGLHCRMTVESLKAGCHVLVEKPMAVSVEECNRMLATAQQCGKHLIVTEGASFYPGARTTGKKFKTGELGRFFTGSIINERFYFHEGRPAWFLDPAMSGGGMFSNVGLHRLAIARACLPGLTPVSVSASVQHIPEYQVEACTSALVKYREGGSMLYEEVGYYPKPDWLNTGTHFIFEKGIVTWNDKVWRLMTRDGQQIEEDLVANEKHYGPIQANLLRAIRGETYEPMAWEYAVDTAIAQGAYASSHEGREVDLTLQPWKIEDPED